MRAHEVAHALVDSACEIRGGAVIGEAAGLRLRDAIGAQRVLDRADGASTGTCVVAHARNVALPSREGRQSISRREPPSLRKLRRPPDTPFSCSTTRS